jgi:hypothetical protein
VTIRGSMHAAACCTHFCASPQRNRHTVGPCATKPHQACAHLGSDQGLMDESHGLMHAYALSLRQEATVGTWQGLRTTAHTVSAVAICSIRPTSLFLPTQHLSCPQTSHALARMRLFSPCMSACHSDLPVCKAHPRTNVVCACARTCARDCVGAGILRHWYRSRATQVPAVVSCDIPCAGVQNGGE